MQNKDLGQYQSKRKFEEYNKKTFNTWLYHESMNTYLDYNALLDIKENLKILKLIRRLYLKENKFKNNFNKIAYFSKRLGL